MQAIIHIIDKKGGEPHPVRYTAPAFFTFHHVNAYEDGDVIYVDVCCYDDASIISELRLKNLRSQSFRGLPGSEVRRFALPTTVPDVNME